jgi:hypothetical protein
MFFRKEKLEFLRQYIHYGSYNVNNKYENCTLKEIENKFKTSNHAGRNSSGKLKENDNVFILSKFGKLWYPFFDLDNKDRLNLFKEIFKNSAYSIFQSSPGKYWGILDKGDKNIKNILKSTNWIVCNDERYIEFSSKQKILTIRGTFKNIERKPKLLENNLVLSKNFSNFIKSLEDYYDNKGLEISCLLSRNENLLLIYNRKIKLNEIN